MDRRTKDAVRGGATALGVATGLLALASTAQTPDGYIHAGFGGPLDVFSRSNSADVLSIGDGSNDAKELAALLKGPVGPAAKDGTLDSPYRIAYEAGAAPNATTGAATVIPSFDPVVPPPDGKGPAILPAKPVVDAQGRIDCTGAVSCQTDPSTNITTVTYPDGLVAVVQKINDLTVVAYKTITEALPSEIATLLPPAPTSPPVLAAVAPGASSTPAAIPSAPSTAAPSTVAPTTAQSSSPPVLDLPALRTPPNGVTPPKNNSNSGTGSTAPSPSPNLPSKVKEAIGGIVDSVKGAVGSVGKALSPGASTKTQDPGPSSNSGSSGTSGSSGQSSNPGQSASRNAGTGQKSNAGKSDDGQP